MMSDETKDVEAKVSKDDRPAGNAARKAARKPSKPTIIKSKGKKSKGKVKKEKGKKKAKAEPKAKEKVVVTAQQVAKAKSLLKEASASDMARHFAKTSLSKDVIGAIADKVGANRNHVLRVVSVTRN